MKLLMVFLLLGCALTPKPKVQPDPLNRCIEIIRERTGNSFSPKKQIGICLCAIKITTDEHPSLAIQKRIYNECIR